MGDGRDDFFQVNLAIFLWKALVLTCRFFAWRPRSNSPLQIPATTNPTTATSEGNKAPDVEEHTVDPLDVSFVSTFRHQHLNMIGQFVPAPLVTPNKIDGKGKQRSEPAESTQALALDAPAPSTQLYGSFKSSLRSLGNHPTSTELSYRRRHGTSPEVIEVPVARGFQVTFNFSRSHLHSY